MTPDELYTQAKESPVLSKEVTDTLLESLEYSSISFLNQAVEILGIFRARLERGDRITVEASGDVLNLKSFRKFVENTFSDYIYGHVFTEDSEQKRSYFHLDACEGGYSLVLAEDGKQNLFEWISSPNERFSFVYMKATKIVYIKNIRTGDYFPFISENGKYCRYDPVQAVLRLFQPVKLHPVRSVFFSIVLLFSVPGFADSLLQILCHLPHAGEN